MKNTRLAMTFALLVVLAAAGCVGILASGSLLDVPTSSGPDARLQARMEAVEGAIQGIRRLLELHAEALDGIRALPTAAPEAVPSEDGEPEVSAALLEDLRRRLLSDVEERIQKELQANNRTPGGTQTARDATRTGRPSEGSGMADQAYGAEPREPRRSGRGRR